MAVRDAGPVKRADLPVVEDWLLASEAAVIMGVSRQYVHQRLRELNAHKISNYVVIPRDVAVAEGRKRAEAEARKLAEEAADEEALLAVAS